MLIGAGLAAFEAPVVAHRQSAASAFGEQPSLADVYLVPQV